MNANNSDILYESHEILLAAEKGKPEKYGYRLLKPVQFEPGQSYPLVLYLHGAGERGRDNRSQLKYLPTWLASPENRQQYPCFVLAPQCPLDQTWSRMAFAQNAPSLPPLSRPMQAVVQALDEVIRSQPIELDRIYLTGISMGGFGSWDLAMRMPERFAALAPVCGGGNVQLASRLVGLPIWAWHGEADDVVPVELSRCMIAALIKAGGQPKYTELASVGHDSWTPAYTDPVGVLPWLFAQRKHAIQ